MEDYALLVNPNLITPLRRPLRSRQQTTGQPDNEEAAQAEVLQVEDTQK